MGCGAKPHDLKSGAAAMREGRSIVISDRRAGNNAPALFFVAGFRAGGAHPPAPLPRPYQEIDVSLQAREGELLFNI